MGHGSNRVDRVVELELRDRLVVHLLLVVNLDRRVMEMAMVEVTMVQIVTS